MPTKTRADVFTAVKGWVTEFSELNWPQDAAVDLSNIEIDNKGRCRRRLGLQREGGSSQAALPAGPSTDTAAASYVWRCVNNNPDDDVIVLQRGFYLHFYGNVYPLHSQYRGSLNLFSFAINTDTNSPDYNGKTPCSMARADAYLFVAGAGLAPVRIQLTPSGPVATQVTLEMRVYEQLSDQGAGVRPSTLSHLHEFSLRNAGWPWRVYCSGSASGDTGGVADPVYQAKQALNVYPATSDLFYAAKTTAANSVESIGAYSSWELNKQPAELSFSQAGHYITPIWAIDTLALLQNNQYTGIGYPLVGGPTYTRSTIRRPSAVGALNGHIVWAATDYNGASALFISQQLSTPDKAGKCFQEADPTAEEINDLVATDGLVLPIPGLGSVVAIEALGDSLIVLTQLGAWRLSGSGDGVGFSATSITVDKVSDFGCRAPGSVVQLNDILFYWGTDGIYALSLTPEVRSVDLTRATIQTWFSSIPLAAHKNITAENNPASGQVAWLIPGAPYGAQTDIVLVLNTNTGGLFKYDMLRGGHELLSIVAPHTTAQNTQANITDNVVADYGSQLITSPGDYVVVEATGTLESGAERRYRYWARNTATNTTAIVEAANFGFIDYEDDGGTADAAAYIEFPYRYGSARNIGFTAPYVTAFFKLKRGD